MKTIIKADPGWSVIGEFADGLAPDSPIADVHPGFWTQTIIAWHIDVNDALGVGELTCVNPITVDGDVHGAAEFGIIEPDGRVTIQDDREFPDVSAFKAYMLQRWALDRAGKP